MPLNHPISSLEQILPAFKAAKTTQSSFFLASRVPEQVEGVSARPVFKVLLLFS